MSGAVAAASSPSLLNSLLLLSSSSQLAQPAAAWQLWTEESAGPGARDGHTIVQYDEVLYLFGGRSNEVIVPHAPTTFEVARVNGSLMFVNYDQKPVRDCGNLSYHECNDIMVGLYYNDVWRYPLRCQRGWDTGCENSGWSLVTINTPLGGCVIQNEKEICTHPAERFGHGAVVSANGTMYIYGGFSRMCEDYCSDMWAVNLPACVAGGPLSPACIWRVVARLGRTGPGKRWRFANVAHKDLWYVFGGQRIWHGFSPANTLFNRWNNSEKYEFGGFMDDMWTFNTSSEQWQQVIPMESCFSAPGIDYLSRNDIVCTVFWPSSRTFSSIVYYREKLYLFGGYRAPLPYPHVLARGAGPGTGLLSPDALSVYPTYPQYLDDLWVFDLQTGLWEELPPLNNYAPPARCGHTLVQAEDIFVLFGGFATNFFLGDTWMYNISSNRWLQKESQVHALFPGSCTSDVQYNAAGDEDVLHMSVLGEPTRGTVLDGQLGRASDPVLIPQPRRKAPGWDGCRDRADGREDLPAALQWRSPSQRAYHSLLYSGSFRMLLLYGGETTLRENRPSKVFTEPTRSTGDLWSFFLDHCANNCTGHGYCFYGHCYCNEGWYGLDCSNATCPGDYCYYDTAVHKQKCVQCCSAPYEHNLQEPSSDIFFPLARKQRCNLTDQAGSHGICNGFGSCQCVPPFLGEDCSIRDCPNKCNGRGWCNIEYPYSRCMCQPPYQGPDCSSIMCPNNCSWPNGECQADGSCSCSWIMNPYNRTQFFKKYGGLDCSFVPAYAGVEGQAAFLAAPLLAAALLAVTVKLAVGEAGAEAAAGGAEEDGGQLEFQEEGGEEEEELLAVRKKKTARSSRLASSSRPGGFAERAGTVGPLLKEQ